MSTIDDKKCGNKDIEHFGHQVEVWKPISSSHFCELTAQRQDSPNMYGVNWLASNCYDFMCSLMRLYG